jgi:hypothetical protein
MRKAFGAFNRMQAQKNLMQTLTEVEYLEGIAPTTDLIARKK